MLKDNLLMLRGIHGFSQEEIAERVGISRQAYAKWESGATIPDVEKCARLAREYGTTVDALLRTEEMDDGRVLPPAPKGKNIWGSVCVNERGQIVIPKAARISAIAWPAWSALTSKATPILMADSANLVSSLVAMPD